MSALEAMEKIEHLDEHIEALVKAKRKLENDGEFAANVIERIIDEKVIERNSLADKLRAVNL